MELLDKQWMSFCPYIKIPLWLSGVTLDTDDDLVDQQ